MVGELVDRIVMILFHRVCLDRSVKNFHLAIGPRVAKLRQAMLNPMVCTRLIEQVGLALRPQMLREERVGELGPIVGQNGVNTKWAIGNQMLKEFLGDGLRHPLMQLDIHIFADTVDSDEQISLLLPKTDFGDIDVHIPNLVRLEFLFFHGEAFPLFRWESVEPVPFQAPIQIGAGEGRDNVPQGDEDIV